MKGGVSGSQPEGQAVRCSTNWPGSRRRASRRLPCGRSSSRRGSRHPSSPARPALDRPDGRVRFAGPSSRGGRIRRFGQWIVGGVALSPVPGGAPAAWCLVSRPTKARSSGSSLARRCWRATRRSCSTDHDAHRGRPSPDWYPRIPAGSTRAVLGTAQPGREWIYSGRAACDAGAPGPPPAAGVAPIRVGTRTPRRLPPARSAGGTADSGPATPTDRPAFDDDTVAHRDRAFADRVRDDAALAPATRTATARARCCLRSTARGWLPWRALQSRFPEGRSTVRLPRRPPRPSHRDQCPSPAVVSMEGDQAMVDATSTSGSSWSRERFSVPNRVVRGVVCSYRSRPSTGPGSSSFRPAREFSGSARSTAGPAAPGGCTRAGWYLDPTGRYHQRLDRSRGRRTRRR